MMYSEFTKLAGFNVNGTYYSTVIEPKYMASELNKQEFVKEWKKQGGIQQAYDYLYNEYKIEKAHHNEANQQIAELREELDDTKDALVAAQQELVSVKDENKRTIDRLREINNSHVEESNILQKKLYDAQKEAEELVYFLIDRSEKGSDAELREYCIKKIGFKKYIAYKMEKGYNLWQLDRDEILKNL